MASRSAGQGSRISADVIFCCDVLFLSKRFSESRLVSNALRHLFTSAEEMWRDRTPLGSHALGT